MTSVGGGHKEAKPGYPCTYLSVDSGIRGPRIETAKSGVITEGGNQCGADESTGWQTVQVNCQPHLTAADHHFLELRLLRPTLVLALALALQNCVALALAPGKVKVLHTCAQRTSRTART